MSYLNCLQLTYVKVTCVSFKKKKKQLQVFVQVVRPSCSQLTH